MELPPRTRRILKVFPCSKRFSGTTSAHAENTFRPSLPLVLMGNYLRARGEYLRRIRLPVWRMELPPRTRRIHLDFWVPLAHSRTTSAHAENTSTNPWAGRGIGNYLRARGEYPPPRVPKAEESELPPRTRRIRRKTASPLVPLGTTSAHAENTFPVAVFQWSSGNYLRARGEYPK